MNAVDVSRRSLRKESQQLAVRAEILKLKADLLLVDDRLPLLNALRESAFREYKALLIERSRCLEFYDVATEEGEAAITLLSCFIEWKMTSVNSIIQSCFRYSLPEYFAGDGQLAGLMLEAIRRRCSKLNSNSIISYKAIVDCRCILQTPWFSPYL